MSQVYLGVSEKLLAGAVTDLVGQLDQFTQITSNLDEADVIILSTISDLAPATAVLHKLKADSKKSTTETPRETAQTLILVSPLHTWGDTPNAAATGSTEEDDEEEEKEPVAGEGVDDSDDADALTPSEPRCFSDESYGSRVPRPSHVVHHELEQMALSLAHDQLRTCVIGAGILYGNGDDAFLPILRDAWLGRTIPLPRLSDDVPDSQTALPTIHVRDLAKAVLSAACMKDDELPAPYIVAVDHSTDSLQSVIRAIARAFQEGTDAHMTEAVAELTRDETIELLVKDAFWASLSLDLSFTPESRDTIDVLIEGIGEGTWESKEGMVANVEALVADFTSTHDLRPVRLHVIAAPYINKEAACEALAKEYYLEVVDTRTALLDILQETPAPVPEADAETDEDTEADNEAGKEPEASIVELVRQASVDGSKLEAVKDGLLVKAMRHYLGRARFRKHGYILCGYPEKRDCAMDYFEIEEEVVGEGLDKKKVVESVTKSDNTTNAEGETTTEADSSGVVEEDADATAAATADASADTGGDGAVEAKEGEAGAGDGETSGDDDAVPREEDTCTILYLSGSDEVLRAHGMAQGVVEKEVEKTLKKYTESLGKGQNTASTFLVANAPNITFVVDVAAPPPKPLAESIPLQDEYDDEEWEAIAEEDRGAILTYKNALAENKVQVQQHMKALFKVVERHGKALNFHPTEEEQELIDAEREADEMSRDLIRRQTKAGREQKKLRAARKKDISARADKRRLAEEEAHELETRAKPLRQYLMRHIMPVLTQGLIECCKNEPEDPVDYLAEFLFRAKVETSYVMAADDDTDELGASNGVGVGDEHELKEGV